jgi:hypothetical protein
LLSLADFFDLDLLSAFGFGSLVGLDLDFLSWEVVLVLDICEHMWENVEAVSGREVAEFERQEAVPNSVVFSVRDESVALSVETGLLLHT